MSTEVVKNAVRYRCDAAACTVNVIKAPDEPPPNGFHGAVQFVGDSGATDKVPWFACGQGHIEAAILYALDRAGQ